MNKIKERRLELNISQKQLATQAGVSSPYLYDLERGHRNAKPETWARIAAVLDCTVEELKNLEEQTE